MNQPPDNRYDGVFGLIVVNLVLYVMDHWLRIGAVHSLYLDYGNWHLYQFVTMAFCHGGFMHLSGNIFMVYVFGRLVEEEEGPGGVVAVYLLSALGASLFSLLLHSPGAGGSVGASGAVFGLFVVATFVKFKPGWRSALETLILGQFTIMQVYSEIGATGTQGNVDHWAHLGGAATAAVAMTWGMKYLREAGVLTAR